MEVGRPINQDEILNNYPLKNAVTMNIHLRKYMLTYYKKLIRDVQQTITAIENELETKE
ncbi:MAG: hypothetical protein HOP08_01265 [Cyclobacteriaceae bacterium]|nr:hypothetical protein [Cyclobacteriaceae bacterium]